MTPLATSVWVANLFCVTVGHLALKAGASVDPALGTLARWKAMLSDFWVWAGIGAFVAEFLLWLAFLSLVPLSLAVLVGSLDTLAVSIGGKMVFGEALTPR